MKVGKYRARACGVEFGTTTKGTDFVSVAFEIDGQCESWTGYLSDAAASRTIQALRLMGWKGSDLSTLEVADLPGWVQVDAREDKDKDGNVTRDDYGNPRVRIAWINSLTGMTSAPMDPDRRRALALRLRGTVAAAPVVAPVLAVEPASAEPDAPPERDANGDVLPPF